MGIREAINRYKVLTIGTACVFVVGAVAMTVFQMRGSSSAPSGPVGGKAYFSADDGKTWFLDEVKNVPPFKKDGKDAVRAYVFSASDGTKFVGYLERYSAVGKKHIEEALTLKDSLEDPFMAAANFVQFKKPGEAEWIGAANPRAAQVQDVVSPKGKNDAISWVAPPQ